MSAPAVQNRTLRPTQRTRTARRFAKKIPTTILVAILLIIVVYPLVWLLLGSFKSNSEFLNNPVWSLPSSFSFDNYVEAWNTGNIAQYATNSILSVFPALALIILFGTAAGFALEVLVWKGRGGVLLAFLIGIMVPSQMILLPLFTEYFTHFVPLALISYASAAPEYIANRVCSVAQINHSARVAFSDESPFAPNCT